MCARRPSSSNTGEAQLSFPVLHEFRDILQNQVTPTAHQRTDFMRYAGYFAAGRCARNHRIERNVCGSSPTGSGTDWQKIRSTIRAAFQPEAAWHRNGKRNFRRQRFTQPVLVRDLRVSL